jgi:hypothetical protein
MFTILSFNHPIRSAVFVYLTVILIIFLFKPDIIYAKEKNKSRKHKNKYKNNEINNERSNNKSACMFPLFIVIISVLSYYILLLLSTWFSPRTVL